MAVYRPKALVLAVALGALACFAPSQVGKQDRQAGDAAWDQRDYKAAAESYRKVVRDDPKDGRTWYRLGFSLHNLERYSEAIPCYRQAIDRKAAVFLSRYNLACALAMSGETTEALQELDRAIKSGYTLTEAMKTDPDLRFIRNTERFGELMRWADRPVQQFSEGRKLEGLVGAWDLVAADGGAGTLTSNAGSNGYSRRLDLFVDGLQWACLQVYFVAPENEWRVSGADAEGAVYEGPVSVQGGSVVCGGKRVAGGKREDVRVRIDVEGWQNGQFTKEAMVDGAWSPVRDFSLNRSERGAGGR